MDWKEFFELYEILRSSKKILYLGEPCIAEYLSKLKKKIVLISLEETKKRFRNVKHIKEHPKKVNLKNEKFDLIFNNLPLDIIGSFSILKNFGDNLLKKGKLIMYFKVQVKQISYARTLSKEFLCELKIKEKTYLKINDKTYLIGEKI